MGQVKFRTTSDIKDVERDFQKLQRENAKLIEQNYKLTNASKEANRQGSAAMKEQGGLVRQGVTGLGQMVAGWVSVGGAVAAVNKGLQHNAQLAREALEYQRQLAAPQQAAITNLAGLAPEERKRLIDQATTISREVGFRDVGTLTTALAASVSASGDAKMAVDAVTQAARLSTATPEQVVTVASGSLDISRASGVRESDKALGFLLSTAAQARVQDSNLLAKNLAPAVSASVLTVAQQDRREASRESAALFSVLSKELVDVSGERTATAQRGLVSGLRAVFGEGLGEGDSAVKAGGPDPGTLFGRLEAVATNEELRAAFLKKASLGEGKLAIEGLLSRPETFAEMQGMARDIRFDAGLTRAMARDMVRLTPELQEAARANRSGVNLDELNRGTLATSGNIQQILDDTLSKTTRSGLLDTPSDLTAGAVNSMRAKMTGDPAEKAQFAIESLRARRELITGARRTPDGRLIPIDKQLSQREQAMVDVIDKQVKLLEEIRGELKKQSDGQAAVIAEQKRTTAAAMHSGRAARIGGDRESQ